MPSIAVVERRRFLVCSLAGLSSLNGLGAPAARAAPLPRLLLAQWAPPDIDPAGYLVSEKLDGVRALWTGERLVSRRGQPLAAPDWFTAGLPPGQPLDGELWLGPGRFDALSAAVRRAVPRDAEWRAIRYAVFEWPEGPGRFDERAARLREIVAAQGVEHLQALAQDALPDRAALQTRLATVLAAGGEGLMLHRADAPSVHGRSDALLKLKPVQDAEAVVIGHQPGQGKYAGLTGALRVQDAQGRVFTVGSGLSDAQRRAPPPLGTVITYRHRGWTPSGLPRFATFHRVRDEP